MKRSSRSKKNLIVLKQKNDFDEINNFFMKKLLEQNLDLREVHEKSLSGNGRIEAISRLHIRYNFDEKFYQRSRYFPCTGKIQELQSEMNCMDDSREFQDAKSVRSGIHHVPNQPVFFPLYRDLGGLSRSLEMARCKNGPPSIWDTWYKGKVFCRSICIFFSTSSAGIESMEFSWNGGSQFNHHGRGWMITKHQSRIRDTSPDPSAEGRSFKELSGRPKTTADLRSSYRQIPYTSYVCLLEDKIQDRGMYLFTIPYGGFAVDQRSGDGWFSGWSKIFVVCKRKSSARILKYLMRGLLQHWTESSIILVSKEESVWRNKSPRKRTVSFMEDRSFTWSSSTSGSLEPTILSRTMPTYSLSVYEWTIFKNSIRDGMEFYGERKNPAWWHLGRIVQTKNTRVWETQERIGIVRPGDLSEEVRTWLSQIEDDGEKKYRARDTK